MTQAAQTQQTAPAEGSGAAAEPSAAVAEQKTTGARVAKLAEAARAAREAAEGGASVDDAVAAATASDEAADVEADTDGAKAKPAKEDVENPIARIQREMRAREKARTIELEAERIREEVEQRASQFDAREKAFAAREAQFQKMMEQFQADPMAAFEANGWNKDKLAEHFAKAGTPEHALRQQLETQGRELAELKQFLTQDLQTRQQREAEQRQQAAQRQRVETEDNFIRTHINPESTPNLIAVAELSGQSREHIVTKADKVADWYKQETGKYPSLEELASYLELEAAEAVAKIRGGKVSPPHSAGKAKATTRTLSQGLSSERRSAPKPARDQTKGERLEAMREAARSARTAT